MISFRYLQINEILTYGTFRRATWAMALQGMPDHPSCTYRTRLVTEVPLPPRWAETKAIGRSACCSVCAITRLVTVKTPASTGTWNRAIHSLPPYRNTVEKQHLGCFHEKSRAETARKAGCKLQLFDLKIKTRSWCKYKIDPLIMTSWLHPPASICTECWYRYPCVGCLPDSGVWCLSGNAWQAGSLLINKNARTLPFHAACFLPHIFLRMLFNIKKLLHL